MAPRPTRNSGGLGDIERLDNSAPAAPQAQPNSPSDSTVERMQQLQAQARLVDNSAAGAGADVVEDDLVEVGDQEGSAPVPDYANLDLEEDVRQFFKTCDDPGTLAHKRRVEDGVRGALQDPFAEPRQGPFPQHLEQRKITKTYSSKGKSRRLSSDSDSELSEEVRRQVRRQLKAQRPITPERKNVDDLFDLFKQLSPGSKKEAVGRLATKDQAAADSDSDASYGNPYTKKKPSVTAPSSSASSSKHKLSPLHMSTHKKKKVAPGLSRYDSVRCLTYVGATRTLFSTSQVNISILSPVPTRGDRRVVRVVSSL
ncbi:unnamed protein product [Tilletia caries]|nr:unnamed protein product [Tilletia caries]